MSKKWIFHFIRLHDSNRINEADQPLWKNGRGIKEKKRKSNRLNSTIIIIAMAQRSKQVSYTETLPSLHYARQFSTPNPLSAHIHADEQHLPPFIHPAVMQSEWQCCLIRFVLFDFFVQHLSAYVCDELFFHSLVLFPHFRSICTLNTNVT